MQKPIKHPAYTPYLRPRHLRLSKRAGLPSHSGAPTYTRLPPSSMPTPGLHIHKVCPSFSSHLSPTAIRRSYRSPRHPTHTLPPRTDAQFWLEAAVHKLTWYPTIPIPTSKLPHHCLPPAPRPPHPTDDLGEPGHSPAAAAPSPRRPPNRGSRWAAASGTAARRYCCRRRRLASA